MLTGGGRLQELSHRGSIPSLPLSRFLDVTQHSPKRGGALHDIQKMATRETNLFQEEV